MCPAGHNDKNHQASSKKFRLLIKFFGWSNLLLNPFGVRVSKYNIYFHEFQELMQFLVKFFLIFSIEFSISVKVMDCLVESLFNWEKFAIYWFKIWWTALGWLAVFPVTIHNVYKIFKVLTYYNHLCTAHTFPPHFQA